MELKSRSLRIGAAAAAMLFLAAAASYPAYRKWNANNYSRIERGRQVAARAGCFACHGPNGLAGIRNPAAGENHEEHIPPWVGGSGSGGIKDEKEIREWIADGMPERVRSDPKLREYYEKRLIRMPSFRGVLSDSEIDDVAEYYKAAAWFSEPSDPAAQRGQLLAGRLDCFACHGPQGRGLVSNPRSFKGYVPAWTGGDYRELVRDDAELEEWIMEGGIKRFQENPAARFFLDRQVIKMPAYKGQISAAELADLKAYVNWVHASFPP